MSPSIIRESTRTTSEASDRPGGNVRRLGGMDAPAVSQHKTPLVRRAGTHVHPKATDGKAVVSRGEVAARLRATESAESLAKARAQRS